MTAPDDDLARAYAAHLTGRLAAGIDPALVAAALVDIARDRGWRPIPRPPVPPAGTGAPPNREYLNARPRTQPKEDR